MERNSNIRQPKGFKVPKKNLKQFREIAKFAISYILTFSGIQRLRDLNIEKFLENGLNKLGIELDIIDDDSIEINPKAPAAMVGKVLKVRNICYIGMCHKVARDLFTLFHELGHYFLGHERQYTRAELDEHNFSEDSEWQANQFAAEAMMPLNVIIDKELRTVEDFKLEFPYVSLEAIDIRIKNLKKYNLI